MFSSFKHTCSKIIYPITIFGLFIHSVAYTQEKPPILGEVESFVNHYNAKSLEKEEIAISAKRLIEKCNQLMKENPQQNFKLVRESLSHLLKLDIEEIQTEAIQALKPLLDLKYLEDDIEQNNFKSLLAMEKQVSKTLNVFVQSTNSSKITSSILEIYGSILERLWILSHLVENTNEALIFLEGNILSMIHQSKPWIELLKKGTSHHPDFDPLLKKVQEMIQKIKDSSPLYTLKSKGEVYKHLGNLYESLKENHKAIDYFGKSLPIFIKLNNRSGEAWSYQGIGYAYENLKEYQKAIEYFEKALPIFIRLKNRSGEGWAYRGIAYAYLYLGESQKALKYYEKALLISIDLKNRSAEGWIYQGISDAYQCLGKNQKAIEYYEKALLISIELKDQLKEAKIYREIGYAYRCLGEYQKAIDYYEKTLLIYIELKDQAGKTEIYQLIGRAYKGLREYQKAIDYYEKALLIYIELKDETGEERSYRNIGYVYEYLGEKQKVIEHFDKARKIKNSRTRSLPTYCQII